MNTSILRNGIIAAGLAVSFVLPQTTLANEANPSETISIAKDKEIKITIDKNTKDSEFSSIMKTLKKHGIEAKFTKIKRNDKNEITGIKIQLKDKKGNESSTSLSSDEPIELITLGGNNDQLFIKTANTTKYSFNGTHSLSKHFDFSFDDDKEEIIINGTTYNFVDMKDKIKESFVIENDGDGKRMIIKLGDFDFDFDFDSDSNQGNTWTEKKQPQKFHFVDDPNIEKLIIIDGKEKGFKDLDKLAKANKLDKVDFLKPETAQSVYGKKAKDGAIIATTID